MSLYSDWQRLVEYLGAVHFLRKRSFLSFDQQASNKIIVFNERGYIDTFKKKIVSSFILIK